MPKYPFLSEEWMNEARTIREEYAAGASVAHSVRMNLNITDVPGRTEMVKAHLDTSSGEVRMELGHIENPEVTVTLDEATAKAIFIEGNSQAGMQAFMSGKIKVQGDLTRLLVMQQAAPDSTALEVQQRLKDITC